MMPRRALTAHLFQSSHLAVKIHLSVSETIRKPPLAEAQTALGKQKIRFVNGLIIRSLQDSHFVTPSFVTFYAANDVLFWSLAELENS